MKSVIFVFPGQGSQVVGIGQAFAGTAAGRELLERADDALGWNLGRVMKEGPLDELTLTSNAQPALLVAGMLAFNHLMRQVNMPPDEVAGLVAGHSLGEYTAVCAAGGMDFDSAVRLVRLRGEEMAKAKGGAMAAVLGLDPTAAEALAGTVAASGIVLANDNSAGQQVFSGPEGAFAAFEEAAKVAGAKRVIRLNVSGAFHTPAMAEAARAVGDYVADKPLKDLSVGCVMNATAVAEHAAQKVAAGLVAQVTGRVRWREGMVHAADSGVTEVVELGVGKVLGSLAARCDARLAGVSLDSPAAIDAWLEAQA